MKMKLISSITDLGTATTLHLAKKPYPQASKNRAKNKLELIHSDVDGPMSVESLFGSKYYLIFIDDMSKFCWIYIMKAKSQMFEFFLTFKAKVELEISCKIKTLRSDNEGEYTSREFTDYLNRIGILYQLTAPYSPQQNGAYRVYLPGTDKVIVSRNVTFEENCGWNWNMQSTITENVLAPIIADVNLPIDELNTDDNFDDEPVRGTRSIYDVYHRSLVAINEPCNFTEASQFPEWKLNPDGSVNKPKARLVAKAFGWTAYHLDIKSAFLNEVLDEEIYVEQPDGFELLLSGDDVLIQNFKKKLESEFDMTNLGPMSYFLGLEINQTSDGIRLSQKSYIAEVLMRFHMDQCKPSLTPLPVNEKSPPAKEVSLKTLQFTEA
ncbi:Uncharacterized protein TCM_036420 [Theobroma cacao]|uniref:Integrase catalytic domain-containing protein n=1 Tax=Theobroma cacao TaxID=3641 RepID=A0A061FKS8_THECC|nr:Uncharacterized protein TCM_036420 [Theobroma cacao]